MEELKKIKRSNIRVIIAIILVILYFIVTVNWYYSSLEELRQRAKSYVRKEIGLLNAQIGSYVGKNKMGIVVKELCDTVIKSNSQMEGSNQKIVFDKSNLVFIKEGNISQLEKREDWENSDAFYKPEDIINLRDAISTNCKYDVNVSYDEQGVIIGIGIMQKGTVQNMENE
ncbi:MAG: hypothetical protein HFJ32_02570 [Clostridia bacterium]|nr:hypothetical protein [Clostridia bacterium]